MHFGRSLGATFFEADKNQIGNQTRSEGPICSSNTLKTKTGFNPVSGQVYL